ncbi:MAG: cell division/cell wall cluster transcriptional repressor MraZ [Thermoplasmata archaeon]|nr:MAG: hypothetical protein B6D55_01175 [Candidatus Omnitrophica bacterium 4484_70.2]RLF31996.1 MAG: cell division/cell wall cluster transcriptional repressor MraZ [Thermoplasmata archaeon]
MWHGEYTHTLDSKDRFVLPAKFREKIKKLKEKKFYLTCGLDGCLFLFTSEVWEEQKRKLDSLSFTKQRARSFTRLYFGRTVDVELDAQGRIVIPQHLKEKAGIKKEVVIVGVGERIEIWDKERWRKFCLENEKHFEEIAETLIT